MHIALSSIWLETGPARRSAQCFGETWSGSAGVWVQSHHTHLCPSKYAVFISTESACLSRYRASYRQYRAQNTPLFTARRMPKTLQNPTPEVLSGDTCPSLYQVFGWRSDQLGGRLNVLGKLGRAQMEFGHTRQSSSIDPFPAVPVGRVGGAPV